MIGLVMAGGRGTRMGGGDKKLLLVHKRPVVLCVVAAMKESGCFSSVVAATSRNAPNTERLLLENNVATIRTEGAGYVSDLMDVLSKFGQTVLVVSGDLPLLDSDIVKQIVGMYDGNVWQSFVVTEQFLRSQNMKAEFSLVHQGLRCYYTGISIVDAARLSENIVESRTILDDQRIALNLNTKEDYSLLQGS
ncbi:MAG: NTP transferase domain-containing protein [Candidatus Nitrosotenuis sp.]